MKYSARRVASYCRVTTDGGAYHEDGMYAQKTGREVEKARWRTTSRQPGVHRMKKMLHLIELQRPSLSSRMRGVLH